MKSVPPPSCYTKIATIFVFLISFGALQSAAAATGISGSYAGSSQRFAVPNAQANAIWQHLSRQPTDAGFQKSHPRLSFNFYQTVFTDIYLDDAGQSLLQNQAALTLRNKNFASGLTHVAVQLPEKLAEQNELYFTLAPETAATEDNWLIALRPNQQADLKQALSNFGLQASDLSSRLQVQQHQKQIRIRDGEKLILLLTHHTVSTRKPACSFTELEITQVDDSEYAAALHQDILQNIHNQFPLIRPETEMHYVKMSTLHAQRPQVLVSSTVGWLGLGLLFSSMSMLVLRRHRKKQI